MKKSISKIILMITCMTMVLALNTIAVLASNGDVDYEAETMELEVGGRYATSEDSYATEYYSLGTVDLKEIIENNLSVKWIAAGSADTVANSGTSATINAVPTAPASGTDFAYDPATDELKNTNGSSKALEIKSDDPYSAWVTIAASSGTIDLSKFNTGLNGKKFLIRFAAVSGASGTPASATLECDFPEVLKLNANAVTANFTEQKVTINTENLDPLEEEITALEYAVYKVSGAAADFASASGDQVQDWASVTVSPIDLSSISQADDFYVYIRYKEVTGERKASNVVELGKFNKKPAIPQVTTDYVINYETETIDLAKDENTSSGNYQLYQYYTSLDESSEYKDLTTGQKDGNGNNVGQINIKDLLDAESGGTVYLRLKATTTGTGGGTGGGPASEPASITINTRAALTEGNNFTVSYVDEELEATAASTYYYFTDETVANASKGATPGGTPINSGSKTSLTSLLDGTNEKIYIVKKADTPSTAPRSKVFTLSLTRPETPVLDTHFEIDYYKNEMTLLKDNSNYVAGYNAVEGDIEYSSQKFELVYNTAKDISSAISSADAFVKVKVLGNDTDKTFPSLPSDTIKLIKPATAPVADNDAGFHIDYVTEKITKGQNAARELEFKKSSDTEYTKIDSTGADISEILSNDAVGIDVRFVEDDGFPLPDGSKLPPSEDQTVSLAARKAAPQESIDYTIDYTTEKLGFTRTGETLQFSTEEDFSSSVVEIAANADTDISAKILDEATTYYIRVKADANAAKSEVLEIEFEGRGTVSGVSFAADTSKISPTTTALEYVLTSDDLTTNAFSDTTTDDSGTGLAIADCTATETAIILADTSTGHIYVRTKATASNPKSKWVKVTEDEILAKPAVPVADTDFEISFADENLKALTTNPDKTKEYSVDGVKYEDLSEVSLTDYIPTNGTVTLSVRIKAGNNSSRPSEPVTYTLSPRPVTPDLTVDYTNYKLKTTSASNLLQLKVGSEGSYADATVNGGVISVSASEVDTKVTAPTTYFLKIKADEGSGTFASEVTETTAYVKPETPVGTDYEVNYTNETLTNKNNNYTMQYSIGDSTDYTDLSSSLDLSELIPDFGESSLDLNIRFKAPDGDEDNMASESIPVTLNARPATPVFYNDDENSVLKTASTASLELKIVSNTTTAYGNVSVADQVISREGTQINTAVTITTNYFLRVKADSNNNSFASKEAELTVTVKPKAPVENDYELNYDNETLTNKNDLYKMQYSRDGSSYTDFPSNKTLNLGSLIPENGDSAIVLNIRFKAPDTAGASPSDSITVTLNPRPATPDFSINVANSTFNSTPDLTGLELSGGEYDKLAVKVNNSGIVVKDDDSSVVSSSVEDTTTFTLRVAAAGDLFASRTASATSSTKASQAAPVDIYVDQRTGVISPVNDKMEYKVGNDTGYTPVEGTTITVEPGDEDQIVYIRFAETPTLRYSEDLELVVIAKPSAEDIKNDVGFVWGGRNWTLAIKSGSEAVMSSFEISSQPDSGFKTYSTTVLRSIMGTSYTNSNNPSATVYIRRRANGAMAASEAIVLEYPQP